MTASGFDLRWVSDHALLASFGDGPSPEVLGRVLGATLALSRAEIPGRRNVHPAYTSVLVVCDPSAVEPAAFEHAVREALGAVAETDQPEPRLVEIPVCYEPDHAPDLADVARRAGLSEDAAASLHASGEYVVCFLGFSPGFPYLAGLPRALATPRLARPRTRVPAGSVAIAGVQAGIYPFATPGGWRLVGRTPLTMFRAERTPPSLLAPGDRVRFVSVSGAEFDGLAGGAGP
jgi:inhibitor of KinA